MLNRFHTQLLNDKRWQAVATAGREFQVTPWVVGGAVRDGLKTGDVSADLDIVVPAEVAQAFSKTLAQALNGKWLCLDPENRIYRVIVFFAIKLSEGEPESETLQAMIDVAACVGKSIEVDLLRRDFTMNAMAYDPASQTLLDPTGGGDDLDDLRIRMVSEANLLDDPLRLIRAFRLAAELSSDTTAAVWDWPTLEAIQTHRTHLFRVAVERIHYEWMRLLSAQTCFSTIQLMADIGMLEDLFPELSGMHAIPANAYHHLGLFDHTLELLNQAELHFRSLPEAARQQIESPFNPYISRLAIVRLACLFHDAGKPPTMAYNAEKDRLTFYTHDAVSANMVWGIAQRYPWGKDLMTEVMRLCRWHLYPNDVIQPGATVKALRKFMGRLNGLVPEMILLAIADRYSTQGPLVDPAQLVSDKAGFIGLWDAWLQYQESQPKGAKLLSGQEVMTLLDLPPGKAVGEAIQKIEAAYESGEITTPEDAKAYLLAQAKSKLHLS